jgi:hypothetical protein
MHSCLRRPALMVDNYNNLIYSKSCLATKSLLSFSRISRFRLALAGTHPENGLGHAGLDR